MGYWDPPEYFDEAKYPEIDAETDTLIEHLVGAIKEEYKDKIAKESDAYQILKTSYDNLARQLTKKNAELLSKDGLIETLNKELTKKKTEHPSFKFNVGDLVFYPTINYHNRKQAFCPRCNGKGHIQINTKEAGLPDDIFETINYRCPDCRDSTGGILYNGAKHFRERDYYLYTTERGRVTEIEYHINSCGKINVQYKIESALNSANPLLDEDSVFATEEEAKTKAKAMQELKKIQAFTDVGISLPAESDNTESY